MSPKLRGLIFDHDGTLWNTAPEIYRAFCHVFNQGGVTPISFPDFCRTVETPFEAFYQRHGVKASKEQIWLWFSEVYRPHEGEIFADVVPAFRCLRKRGIVLGVVSGHPSASLAERYAATGINGDLHSVVGDNHNKVEAILEFCQQCGLAPEETGYIGDFISDPKAACQAGVRAIGITRGNDTAEALLAAGAHHCIDHLPELFRLL